jgi:hypothetical protein
MNENQLGLCLACSTPWVPSVKSFLSINRLGSLSLLYFENECQNNDEVKAKMVKDVIPHFVSKRNIAHVVHYAHHTHALLYSIQNLCNNNGVNNFPFAFNPGSRGFRAYRASWGVRPAVHRINYTGLFNLLSGLVAASVQNGQFAPVAYKEVFVCNDCNSCMSMRFWFRYHLNTSNARNPHRLIPNNVITVYNVDTHGNNSLRPVDYAQWTNLAVFPVQYPDVVFTMQTDFFTAYLAYYLQLCLPVNIAKPNNVQASQQKWRDMLKVYMGLSWIVLEIACLACEYRMGSQKKNKMTHLTKSILGNIELYLSYFYWAITCFRNQNIQNQMTFENWHQFYMSDLPGSHSFVQANINTLPSLLVVPPVCNVPSKLLVETVCANIVTLYTNHVRQLSDIVLNQHNYGPAVVNHFISQQDMNAIKQLLSNVNTNIFDNVVAVVGIQAIWKRIMLLCQDLPEPLKAKMRLLLEKWIKFEKENVIRNTQVFASVAGTRYNRASKNRDFAPHARGVWASVVALRDLRAFEYDPARPRTVDMFKINRFDDLFA